jgi:hypothetical protein
MLVFLTDLYGPAPKEATGYDVLWASTGSRHAPFSRLVPMQAAWRSPTCDWLDDDKVAAIGRKQLINI